MSTIRRPSPPRRSASSPKIVKAVALRRIPLRKTAEAEPDTAEAPPPDDGLGFLTGEPVPRPERASGPKRRPAPAVAAQSPAKDEPGGDLASIAGLAKRSSKGAVPHPAKKKKPGLASWAIPAIAAAGVAALVGIGATIYLISNSKTARAATLRGLIHLDRRHETRQAGKSGAEGSRADHRMAREPAHRRMDDSSTAKRRPVPPTGAIEIPVPPAKDQYRFVFQRPKFKPQTLNRVFPEDDKYALGEWEPLDTGGLGWEQDFDAAKLKAASDKKNVFILFDASDVKENSYASGRLKEAVVKRKEFHDRAEKEFVCVYIDNPKNAEAQDEVKDADRNQKLTEKFKITVFPTVVVTDPKGPAVRRAGRLQGQRRRRILIAAGQVGGRRQALLRVVREVQGHEQGEPGCRTRRARSSISWN